MLFFFFINHNCKRIIKDQYGIEPKSFLWNDSDFYVDVVLNKLKDYLREEQLIEQVNQIMVELERQTEELKAPSYINKGILSLIFIPLWAEIIRWTFNYAEKDLAIAIDIAVIFFVFAVTIIFLYYCVHTIWDDLANSDYRRLKKLRNALAEIKISSQCHKLD